MKSSHCQSPGSSAIFSIELFYKIALIFNFSVLSKNHNTRKINMAKKKTPANGNFSRAELTQPLSAYAPLTGTRNFEWAIN